MDSTSDSTSNSTSDGTSDEAARRAALDDAIGMATRDAARVHPVHARRDPDAAAEAFAEACLRLNTSVAAYAAWCRTSGFPPETMVIAVKAAAGRGVADCRDRDVLEDLMHRVVRCATDSYYRTPVS